MNPDNGEASYQAAQNITCRPRCLRDDPAHMACVCERATFEQDLLETHQRFWKFDAERTRFDEPIQAVTCYLTPPDRPVAEPNGRTPKP